MDKPCFLKDDVHTFFVASYLCYIRHEPENYESWGGRHTHSEASKKQGILLPSFLLMWIMKPNHANGHMICHISPIQSTTINAHLEKIMPNFSPCKTHRHRRCHVVAIPSQVKQNCTWILLLQHNNEVQGMIHKIMSYWVATILTQKQP